jgi:hypothetical protein
VQHLFQPAVIKRFAIALPGKPFTADASKLSTAERMALQQNDPEIMAILDGSCDASVLAAVVSGTLPDAIPSIEERQEVIKAQRIAELTAAAGGIPGRYEDDGSYTVPVEINSTALFELSQLDAAAAEAIRLRTAAFSSPEQQRMQQQAAAAADAEARLNSMNHAYAGY